MENDTELMSSTQDEEDTPETLYKVELEVMVKDFVSQKSGNSKRMYEIHCNSPEEFSEMVWTTIQPYIETQIIYNDQAQSYEWSHNELDATNLDKFVSFQDKVSKRTYEVLAITKKLLQSWKNKKGLVCFVHVYGTVLKKKQHYEVAYKNLIQAGAVDRAGATTNIEVFKCIDELKALHTDLIATEASWLRWANWIQKQHGHEREILMRQGPPTLKPNLFELFKIARSEPEHMQEVRNGIAIGKRVNEGVASAIPKIEEEIDELIDIFKSGLHRAERIKTHLACLKSQLSANDNLMDGFAESLGPTEDGFSRDLLRGIENVDDVDHQQLLYDTEDCN